ncbi:hypothetical protein AB0M50_23925 [Nonomuraea fuscirosea]|jgi:hypothetical protein|uniref:hypothetical protein n=1 Tax=Nonomuraea fuscirosea TaxID=1291556 RepID=UPI002DDB1AB4|nr:hypothetical protein [Nonomuraea fuscirosea]WSA58191.1 hypothetical protein OIE67_27255 [Nonomuraea fuscirosea]
MSSDELKVPSQRNDIPDEQPDERPYAGAEATADEKRVHEDRLVAGDPDQDRDRYEDAGQGDLYGDARQGGPSHDAYPAAVPHDGAAPRDGAAPDDEDDASYRDPYARTGGDMLAEPEHAHDVEPEQADPVVHDGQAAPGEVPAHAAPEEIVLFEQDPTQVQARWRDLQASFVDDPGEAVQRADGLVGEVVDALTSALNNRTGALRDRWKDAGGGDTEQLRLALREYRTVLERLLALSGQPSGQSTPASSEGMR